MSMMYGRDDWARSRQRYDAFWDHAPIVDRCVFAVTAPKDEAVDTGWTPRPAQNVQEQWESIEYRMNALLHTIANTYYGGDAFAFFRANMGPDPVAAFASAPYVLRPDTVWYDTVPILREWGEPPYIHFNRQSSLYQLIFTMTEHFAKNAHGRYFNGLTSLCCPLDTLAALRGSQTLLMDLVDEPEKVKEAIWELEAVYQAFIGGLQDVLDPYQEGTAHWLGIWCAERMCTLQCDFSAMISPAMFEEFVLPSVTYEADHLRKSIYHLDGVDAIKHLDLLLTIQSLTGIQWVAGAGQAPLCDAQWWPLYQKIQRAGKNLCLCGVNPDGVEGLLDVLSPEGLFISTACETESDAKDLLRIVEKQYA